MQHKKLTQQQKEAYDRDGYLLIPFMFSPKEIELLYGVAIHDDVISKKSYDRGDKEGFRTRLALWYSLDNDIYSLLARSERIVSGVEMLLEGEPAHFHSKLMQKEPKVGGAWEWHQDYGYWYYNGCLRPDMLSCMIALDRSDRNNGCLQIVRGSHKLGRVDHTPLTQGQNEVDPKRMEHILARYTAEYCELYPGDVLIFHSNAIHRSDANRSPNRRWTLLVCYNRVDNDTVTKADDRYYVPLERVDDDAIHRAGLKFADGSGQEHFASRPFVPKVTIDA